VQLRTTDKLDSIGGDSYTGEEPGSCGMTFKLATSERHPLRPGWNRILARTSSQEVLAGLVERVTFTMRRTDYAFSG
jgi:hypothetical protein